MQETVLHSDSAGPLFPEAGGYSALLAEQSFTGRDGEIHELKKWVKRFPKQDSLMLLVEGKGGVGKTALINRLISELYEQSDFCLYGKFHNAPSKVPFLAIRQCMHHWLDQLLILKDETYEKLKHKVREAVHPNEKVLTSVFEELEILFGKSNPLADDLKPDPLKLRQRFTFYFYTLLKAIYESGFRTILFLDDLQWADHATLHLIHDLLNTYKAPGLLIIGAFRPLSGERNRGLIQKLQGLKAVKNLFLKPLPEVELAAFLPPAWKLSENEQKAFLEYLIHESGGYPFDVLHILNYIAREKLIEATTADCHQVRWSQLPHFNRDQNATSLILQEIKGLSLLSSKLLQLASCLGFYFSCERLKQLSGLNKATFREGLDELTRRKIVITQEEVCYFVHDHFYTAAQELLQADDRKRIHAEIARFLINSGALDMQHPGFLECINHLNLAGVKNGLLQEGALAVVNLTAARLAQRKSAFDKSLEYFKIAGQYLSSLPGEGEIELPGFVPKYDWLPEPLVFRKLFNICKLGVAEGEFLVQNFILADQTLNYIFDQVEDRMMRLKGYTIKMKICIACLNLKEVPFKFKDGMGIIEALLLEYGIKLPQSKKDFEEQMEAAYLELVEKLPTGDIGPLEYREISGDQEFHDFIHLVVHSLPIIFFVNIEKSKYLAVKSMLLCMDKGFTPSTPSLFASSIWTIATTGNDYELAYKLGQLGLKMVEREPYKVYRHSVYHLATLNFYNWKNHYRESSARLDEAVKISLGIGDLNYAIFCFTNARIIDIIRGVPLNQLMLESHKSRREFLNINFISRSHQAFVSYMTGKKQGLKEGRFTFSNRFKQQVQENQNGLYHFSFVKELLYLHAGLYPEAMEAGSSCEKHRSLYEAFPVGVEHDFYYCLILVSLAEEGGELSMESRAHISKRLEGLRTLASMGSGNYLHKQKILEAELAKFQPACGQCVLLYEEAIEEALRQEFIHFAALAAERCGDYLLKRKRQRSAETFLVDAYNYYEKWGAGAKTEQLVQKYPEVSFGKLQHTFLPEQAAGNGKETLSRDLVQSAINLSQELYVSDLISRVLHISLGQTNAKQASFLLKQQFSWQVVARLDEEGLSMLHQSIPAGSVISPHKTFYDCLKLNEICYVPGLTDRHELYDVDYFKNKAVHSIMVIPFERHQETLGLIYLENFDTELVEKNNLLPWFELLRTQTGIALSNARLFENQVKLNEELRRQEEKRILAVVETQEKERKRVAAELHDHLGQMLSLTKLNLSRLEDSLEGQFKLYEETCSLLDESCSELRRIAHDMMPPDFTAKSLEVTLDNLFRGYLLAAGLKYNFYQHQLPVEIPVAVKFNIYRIAQEIIHNVIKHANARKVTIELSVEDNQLHMMIEDDGKGFDTCFKTDGLGLKSLYTRASLLNGHLEIDSGINRGSVFDVYIPLP